MVPGNRYASLDGDADRIVYYFRDNEGVFQLLDGDKIAILAAQYIIELVRQAQLKVSETEELQVGLVQTAYANGASTLYAQNVVVPIPNQQLVVSN